MTVNFTNNPFFQNGTNKKVCLLMIPLIFASLCYIYGNKLIFNEYDILLAAKNVATTTSASSFVGYSRFLIVFFQLKESTKSFLPPQNP